MTADGLTDRIRRYAADLGFCKVGVTRADRLGEESEQLREWLDRGYHGTMKWMEANSDKRADPFLLLPGAKSIVSVALNYYTDIRHAPAPTEGKISRYAWGDDYHGVMLNLLEKLLAHIKGLDASADGKVYVDTGPVMDKVWAVRAGIGWEGKHTNVITQEHGSWVFLGEILLNLELACDTPATDHCGSCTRCLDACPTQAIVEPYVVDSNKCISYVTIEHRGEIAKEVADHLEGWIYGCDICQDVCPWNQKFSTSTSFQEFLPRRENLSPELTAVLDMTQEEFSKTYSRSPIKRAKLSGLKRNAQRLLALPAHDTSQRMP